MVGLPTSLPSSKDGKAEEQVTRESRDQETYEVTCRVSRILLKTLQSMRVPLGYTSMKALTENLVEENSFEVHYLIKGVGDYIDFAREVEELLGVDRHYSGFHYREGQFSLGKLDHAIYMDLGIYESGGIKSVEVEADMGKADVIRATLIKGVYDKMEEDYIDLDYSRRRKIIDAWYEVRNSFARYHRNFEALLKVNFVDNKGYVEQTFENFSGKANDFARYYKNEFVDSDGYERMMEMEVHEPFEEMEKLINEHTRVEVYNHADKEE